MLKFILIAVIVVWSAVALWIENRQLYKAMYRNWMRRRAIKKAGQVEALCLGCLAVNVFPDYESALHGTCNVCLSDTCPCEGCAATIQCLDNGITDKEILGVEVDVEKWNRETGIYDLL